MRDTRTIGVGRAPERIETARLILRRPTRNDVLGIFGRYASDPEVTHYLSWKRHVTVDDTLAFLDFSDSDWLRWGCGPYVVRSRATDVLLGSTGLVFDEPDVAATGYVFARDAWGCGYATESLRAMVDLAGALSLRRLYAVCHTEHRASAHVMEKCGFRLEGVRSKDFVFPNIGPEKVDVLAYAWSPDGEK